MEREHYLTGKDGDEAERFFHLAERSIVDETQINLPSLEEFMQRMLLRTGEASVARVAFGQHRQAAIAAALAYMPQPDGPPPPLREQLQELIRQLQERTRPHFNPSPQLNKQKFQDFTALAPPDYLTMYPSPTDAYNKLCALFRHVSGPNGTPEHEAVMKFMYVLNDMQPPIQTQLVNWPPLGSRVIQELRDKVHTSAEFWTLAEAHTIACKLWEEGKHYLAEELKQKHRGMPTRPAVHSATRRDARPEFVDATQWQGYATASMPAHVAPPGPPAPSYPLPFASPPPPPAARAPAHTSAGTSGRPQGSGRPRCACCNATNHAAEDCWRLHPAKAPPGWAGPKSEVGYNQWVSNRPAHWPPAPLFHMRPVTPTRQRPDNPNRQQQQGQGGYTGPPSGGFLGGRGYGGGRFHDGGRGGGRTGRGQIRHGQQGYHQTNSVHHQPPAQLGGNAYGNDMAQILNAVSSMQRQFLQSQQHTAANSSSPYHRDYPPNHYHANPAIVRDSSSTPAVVPTTNTRASIIHRMTRAMNDMAAVVQEMVQQDHDTTPHLSPPTFRVHVVTANDAYPAITHGQVNVTTRQRQIASFTQQPTQVAVAQAEQAPYTPPPVLPVPPIMRHVEPPPVVMMEGGPVATNLAQSAMALAAQADDLLIGMRSWARRVLGNNQPSLPSRTASIVALATRQVSEHQAWQPEGPPAHMVNQIYTVAYLLNQSMSTGISVLGPEGWELYTRMMMDCGCEIMGVSKRVARALRLATRKCCAKMITFGDHEYTVTEIAPQVSFRFFGGTDHEIIVQYDCYVMDDSSQYDFLLGQPMYCDWRINMGLMAYFNGIIVCPELASQEMHETVPGDGTVRLGRMYVLPCRMTKTSVHAPHVFKANMVLEHTDPSLTERTHLLHMMDNAPPTWLGQGPDPGIVTLPFAAWDLSALQAENLREWRFNQLKNQECTRCQYKLCRCYYAPGDVPPFADDGGDQPEPATRRTTPADRFVHMHADDRLDSLAGLHLNWWLDEAAACTRAAILARLPDDISPAQLESRIAHAWFDMCLARCEEYSLPLAILCAMKPIPSSATRTQLFDWMKAELFAYRAYSAGRDLLNMLSQRTHFTPYIVLAHAVVPTPIHLRHAREVVRDHFGPLARYAVYESREVCITCSLNTCSRLRSKARRGLILFLTCLFHRVTTHTKLTWCMTRLALCAGCTSLTSTERHTLALPHPQRMAILSHLTSLLCAPLGGLLLQGEVSLDQVLARETLRTRIRFPAISVPISRAALVRAHMIPHLL